MVTGFHFLLQPLFLSLKSEYHTSLVLLRRLGRRNIKNVTREPGLSGTKILNAADSDYLESLDSQESEGDELDLMKMDMIYDDVERQNKAWKRKVGFKIAAQKFFTSGRQPQMLTYNEKLCIKYLHNQDPVQWNVTALSESFPATPLIIQKILRSNWKASKERILKMDQEVQNNWKLLKEGKLQADPELIEHLKKFTDRQMILLDQIKNEKFYLPEVKKEKKWNNGEMSSILRSYELSINKLIDSNLKKLSDKNESNDSDTSEDEKNNNKAIHKLYEKVNEKLEKLDVEEKDNFSLGYITKTSDELITYEKLCSSIEQKHKNKKNLDLSEKAILEYQMTKKSSKYSKNEPEQNLITKSNDSNNIESNDNNSTESNGTKNIIELNNNNKNAADRLSKLYEPFLSQKNKEIKKSIELKNKWKDRITKLKNEYIDLEREKKDYIFQTGKGTKLLDALEVGKILEKNHESLEPEIKPEKSHVKRFNELLSQNPERAIKDQKYYEKEVQDIKYTSFWNGQENSEKKALREKKKEPLRAPITQNEMFNVDLYPEKIKIPPGKRHSGLTFKFKDCYYDDNGEFLYRVPGMKS